ncbi:guanine nucleotide binding protein [Salpingoeca rosetta]|uniref:Guanine nucleotide binding protein n=1 Tax=Salpingoeca rosetta (strain ATCC 50818 / BSB-021) TaxID=946362 RepID=F2TYP3_SALR5|nr:guanine nucleotide binding protein [Salpingoeca rosetta]EGD78717.1 guanine nucleotide binding protein [Salpingoeca rosetta]|eukprot:XP_004997674.1 guanine nucleotide binding protein [Salpingoeca rosetta]
MSCGSSETDKRSKKIDKALRKAGHQSKGVFKILLLGTGESGKSTVVKQMKILYCGGFGDEERQRFRILVFRNCLRSMKALVDAMDLLEIAFENQSLIEQAYDLLDISEASFTDLAPHKELFRKLWEDKGVQKAYARRDEFQLSVSTAYFFDKLNDLCEPSYIPDNDDILRAREATTGIHEVSFEVEKATFRMLDVGGQRSERRKWIHCFENITSIIFISAANEYDQVLAEDSETNRMKESVALFAQIIGYWWFRETSFVLFLNKQDLLEEKVKRSSLKKHFPEFPGPDGDYEAAREFIQDLYFREKPETHQLFVHFTTATNTENIYHVFNAVRSTLIRSQLKNLNLY